MARSKILPITLVVTIISASIFCCCLGDLAHAKEQGQAALSHVPECHRQAAQEQAPTPKECECQKILSLVIQKSTIDHQLAQLEFLTLDKFLSSNLELAVTDGQTELALSQAPPGILRSSIPLYLQHSNLRL